MDKNYFLSGAWNLTCDVCSKKIKAQDAKQRWDGLIVCPSDFEHRHEQDYVRARTDKITVPFTRPIPTLVFGSVCTTFSAVPSYAIPGCMQPGNPAEPGIIPT